MDNKYVLQGLQGKGLFGFLTVLRRNLSSFKVEWSCHVETTQINKNQGFNEYCFHSNSYFPQRDQNARCSIALVAVEHSMKKAMAVSLEGSLPVLVVHSSHASFLLFLCY